ncbi:MAG TPA: hypothetical protein VJB87_01470 [Candidatus Nanoarchaeia archaeon]|nr:hypothetical protein [Candidatus Nanoarchaeia archaeon]
MTSVTLETITQRLNTLIEPLLLRRADGTFDETEESKHLRRASGFWPGEVFSGATTWAFKHELPPDWESTQQYLFHWITTLKEVTYPAFRCIGFYYDQTFLGTTPEALYAAVTATLATTPKKP